MSSTTYPKKWSKTAIFANEFNFFYIKSRIHHHFVDANKMCATQEQFRHVTKMVCGRFRDLKKTYHLGNVTVMVRNAGQLPQPFWLGVACGGGSCSAARCAART